MKVENPPVHPTVYPNDSDAAFEPGMTLRDHFAAKAIEGACNGNGGLPDGLFLEVIAKRAYQLADAMLSARSTA